MTVAVCCVAVGLLVFFAGGPNELLRVLDRALHSVAEVLFRAYQNFRV